MLKRLRKFGILGGIATLVALFTASQLYLEVINYRPETSFFQLFLIQFLQWQFWAALAPFIEWCGRRFRIESGRLLSGLAFHIPFGVFVAASHVAFVVALNLWLSPPPPRQFSFFQRFLGMGYTYHVELFTYWAILGTSYAFEYYRKFREREIRATQLEAQLAQANLQALKMQLHPHFLFNTLNAVASLVRKNENRAAINMLVGVSELLRHVLDKTAAQEVTLKEELEFIERYLEIQQIRFSDRLKINFDVAPETLGAVVPNLILQPVVENAIRHGISPRATASRLEISARREGEMLKLTVFNDGNRLSDDWNTAESRGLGISNTQTRLQQIYGAAEQHGFELKNTDAGVMATILLPFKITQTANKPAEVEIA